jgi:hypothetical protein
MADFYAPQFNPPADVLGSYLRGRMAPGVLQQQQQELQQGRQDIQGNSLKLEQLQLALRNQQAREKYAQQLEYPQQGVASAPMIAPQDAPLDNSLDGILSRGSVQLRSAVGIAIREGRDPLEVQQKSMEMAKAQYKPIAETKIANYEALKAAEHPATSVLKNPALMQSWQKYVAMNPGMDIANDLNDDNVRRAIDYGINIERAQMGEAVKPSGYSGTLSPGQTAYEGGRPIASAPETISPYQQAQLGIERQRLANEGVGKPTAIDVNLPGGAVQKQWLMPRQSEGIPIGAPHNPNSDKPPSESDKKVADLYLDVVDAEKTVRALTAAGTTDTSSRTQAILGSGPARWIGVDSFQSDKFRKYEAAGQRWAANLLYIKSGATANTDEVRSTWKQYFPQPGEGAGVATQKAEARKQAIANVAKVYGLKNPLDDAPPGAPAVGAVVKGHRFKGGNPADRNNWEKVGG